MTMYRNHPRYSNLYENVSTGRAKAASRGLTPQKPHESADEIRKRASAARAAADAAAAQQRAEDARAARAAARKAAVRPLPSRAIDPEEKVLRGIKFHTPKGKAKAKLTLLKKQYRTAATDYNTSTADLLRLDKRINTLTAAIKGKNLPSKSTWKQVKEDVLYLLDYLMESGYVNSIDSAIEIAENMSDGWLYSVLYE